MRERRNRVMALSMLIVTIIICAVWFPLVTSGNIRADSERMIHQPEVALAQYASEGRVGLVFLLRLFGLDRWDPMRCGILFLLFFVASAWVVYYGVYRFSGKKHDSLHLLIVLLYALSPIWAFQAYFVLQIAGVGFGMMIMSLLAGADMIVFVERKSGAVLKSLCAVITVALICLAITVYQALAIYYVAVSFAFLLCHFHAGGMLRLRDAAIWVVAVVLAPVFYWVWQRTTQGGVSAYLMQQIKWGALPAGTCVKNIIIEIGKTVLAVHSGHASLYSLAVALYAVAVIRDVRAKNVARKSVRWELLAAAALLLLPFVMSVFYGDRPVPRTQFALQVTSAVIPVWFMLRTTNRRLIRIVACVCVVAMAIQAALVLRLYHTDNVRNERDIAIAGDILPVLDETGAENKWMVVLGGLPFEDRSLLLEKTDVYGMSFFEWSYEPERPGSDTSGAIRLFQAMSGKIYSCYANADQLNMALEAAVDMPAYPEDGFVRELDDCVVVKLSE